MSTTIGKHRRQVDRLAEIIREMEAKLSGDGPHSLCDTRLSEETYRGLRRWVAEKLERATVRLAGWHVGAILFHLICEVARREAQGHCLWPIVAESFPAHLRREFFVNNQPSAELKRLIRKAAQELDLRHVFDDDGGQSWYITTHLQFGFTYHGMQDRLPEWLCGINLPSSVQRLLAGNLASETFRDLWHALRYYRRDWITEEHVRSIIKQSPWVVASWEDELVLLAREKPDLISAEEQPDDDEHPAPSVLGTPTCIWDDTNGPQFTSALLCPSNSDWQAPHYDVHLDGRILATFFRQPNGSYRTDQGTVRLEASTPEIAVQVVDTDGVVQLIQLIEIWDPAADVSVFDLRSGHRLLNPLLDAMSESKDYVLLAASDLVVRPEPNQWVRLPGPSRITAALLAQPWAARDLCVETPDGAIVWRPTVMGGATPCEPPELRAIAVQPQGRARPVAIGESIQPVVRDVPNGATIVSVRLGSKPLAFDPTTGVIEPVTVTPELAHSGFMFLVGIRMANGGAHAVTIRRPMDVPACGAATLAPDGWHAVRSRELLTVQSCRDQAYRITLPPDHRTMRAALMEGAFFLRWIGHRAGPLGRAWGTGARLEVRKQPYNCSTHLVSLAQGVTNGGIIRAASAEHTECATRWCLTLDRAVNPSREHGVVCWPCGPEGDISCIEPDQIESNDGGHQWILNNVPHSNHESLIVGIHYRGRWLGTAWHGDLLAFMESLNSMPGSAHLPASLLRWLQLPVLLRDRANATPSFAHFAHQHPAAVLTTWLRLDGLPPALEHDVSFERQQVEAAVLRDLFLAWTPSQEASSVIVAEFGNTNPHDPLGEAVLALLPTDPLLAGHLMLVWIREHGTPAGTSVPLYLEVLRRRHLGLPIRSHKRKEYGLDGDLQRAAQTMRVDPNALADEYFVRCAIADPAIGTLHGHALTPQQRSNLQVALQVASFRRYLVMRVFQEIETTFGRK